MSDRRGTLEGGGEKDGEGWIRLVDKKIEEWKKKWTEGQGGREEK